MGCSASKNLTLVAKNSEEDQNSPSLVSSTCYFSSPSASHLSNSSSPQVPKALSLPMPLVHHPATKKGDTHHLVSLTSTTYGSLLLIDQKDSNFNGYVGKPQSPLPHQNQTQLDKSLSPDSVINTWELMDGLNDFDDNDNLDDGKSNFDIPLDGSKKPSFDSFSEIVINEKFSSSPSSLSLDKKPLWQHLSEEALLAKLDPNVAWSYRRALSSRQLGTNNKSLSRGLNSLVSITSSTLSSSSISNNLCIEDRVVVYYTSLRGIRKTYEDCCAVRVILKGFRVVVDEKDISMDSSYRKELESALGGKVVTLPQVFIRGKHVGDAEEIKLLNESGELANLLKGFPIRDPWFVCESCGDARFVPCTNCNGSRKVFEKEEGELRRCTQCNENGLISCMCCSL